MEALISFDKELFLVLNSLHSQSFDFIMYWITDKFFWIPLYLVLIILIIQKFKFQSLLILLSIAVLILLVDQTTSTLMKPFFSRLRPCHDTSISTLVHLVTPCGGKYGFISGHAANTFSIATFLYMIFATKRWVWLFFWAGVVSYSRLYVGVHYPLDILAGVLYGVIIGAIIHRINVMLTYRIFKQL